MRINEEKTKKKNSIYSLVSCYNKKYQYQVKSHNVFDVSLNDGKIKIQDKESI